MSSLNCDILYISEDVPGQETFKDDEPALPPDLEWLEELYEWVLFAFLGITPFLDNEIQMPT